MVSGSQLGKSSINDTGGHLIIFSKFTGNEKFLMLELIETKQDVLKISISVTELSSLYFEPTRLLDRPSYYQ